MALSQIEDAIEAMRRGEMIIVVDDDDRENEGDLVIAADAVTPEAIAFMMNHGRGLICVSLSGERLDELDIPLMVSRNSEAMNTAFTVSVDLRNGITTGISASDRAMTIKALTNSSSQPDDFARPGHIFPLRANSAGVLGRRGHTEASMDLAGLAGRFPCGVICEVSNDDGSMARLPQLTAFARRHGLLIVSIADLVAYRQRNEAVVRKATSDMPTRYGTFKAIAYNDNTTGAEHIALMKEGCSHGPVKVRVHSECLTGEALGSLRCDCGAQLEESLRTLGEDETGCLIYLRGHEGRGIGLANKIAAYGLQDQGMDTFEANVALGLPLDARSYAAAAAILKDLGIGDVILLTNSPQKVKALGSYGVHVVERRDLHVTTTKESAPYLKAKEEALGHSLDPLWKLERLSF